MRAAGLKRSKGGGARIGCVLDIDFRKVDVADGQSFMSKDVYGHLCTVTGGLWRPNGRYFDGDDKIDCGNDASLNLDASDFTLLERLKTSSYFGMPHVIQKGAAGTYYSNAVYHTGGKEGLFYAAIDVDGGGAKETWSTTVVSDGEWHFCTSVFDRDGNLSICIDGVAEGTPVDISAYSSGVGTTADLLLCSVGTGNYLTGYIGEVGIYNRAEYAARILQRAIRSSSN